jgi:hypothetical protein
MVLREFDGALRDRCVRKVESDRSALCAFLRVGFSGPSPEPDVRLLPHPALHESPRPIAGGQVVPSHWRNTPQGGPMPLAGDTCSGGFLDLSTSREMIVIGGAELRHRNVRTCRGCRSM